MSLSHVEVISDEHVMPGPSFSTAQPTYGASPQPQDYIGLSQASPDRA